MATYTDTMILNAERIIAISETNNPTLFAQDKFARAHVQPVMGAMGIEGCRIVLTGGIAEAIRERMQETGDPQAAALDAFRCGLTGTQYTTASQELPFALVLVTITRNEMGAEMTRLSWRFDGCGVKADEQGNWIIESKMKPGKPVFRIDAE